MKSSILILNLIILFMFIPTGHALAQTHTVDGEYIKEWLLLRPFDGINLEQDHLVSVGGEANVQPKGGDTITTASGKTLSWKRYASPNNWVSLRANTHIFVGKVSLLRLSFLIMVPFFVDCYLLKVVPQFQHVKKVPRHERKKPELTEVLTFIGN